jgi:hypothetical protein
MDGQHGVDEASDQILYAAFGNPDPVGFFDFSLDFFALSAFKEP